MVVVGVWKRGTRVVYRALSGGMAAVWAFCRNDLLEVRHTKPSFVSCAESKSVFFSSERRLSRRSWINDRSHVSWNYSTQRRVYLVGGRTRAGLSRGVVLGGRRVERCQWL